MLNLAPFFYGRIHRDQGGPVSRIAVRSASRLGRSVFEAFVDLEMEVMPNFSHTNQFYGNAHGTGTGDTKSEAIYRAISEALERWAWHWSFQQNTSHDFLGKNLDSSTTGFAAFPGITGRSARPFSYWEAMERWSVCAWWERRLAHIRREVPWDGVEGLEILSPIYGGSVAVLWKQEGENMAYGFSCGPHWKSASLRASVELGRNLFLLSEVSGQMEEAYENGGLAAFEKRFLFFSMAEGMALFLGRVRESFHSSIEPPGLVVDHPVMGPWQEYTKVWRCLFDPKELSQDRGEDYFLF